MSNLVIYTDGAYSPTRDCGGVGIVFIDKEQELRYCKSFNHTTNNQMEIAAVVIALQSVDPSKVSSIQIISDSQYVIGCASKGWKRKKNPKLWKQYDQAVQRLAGIPISFTWVAGHNGDKFNELADQLAVFASHQS